MSQKHTYNVPQIHCSSCKILIESTLTDHPQVEQVNVNLDKRTVTITAQDNANYQDLQNQLTSMIQEHGYSLESSPQKPQIKYQEYMLAGFVTVLFVIAYWFLQNSEIAQFIKTDSVSYPVAFLIGIAASLSSCMAVVGSLLLGVSTNWAKQSSHSTKTNTLKNPHLLFHAGRLLSFLILGALLGVIGSFFTVTPLLNVVLTIVLTLMMLALGLKLLNLFHLPSKFQFQWPAFLMPKKHYSGYNIFAPALLGALTFFLPCGFTQSMQFYALTLSNPLDSGLIMLSFALGTLPVLAMLSFSAFSFSKSKYAGIFFKTVGMLIILFALYNLYSMASLFPLLFS